MKIGLAFTLKTAHAEAGRPDDWQEEFDSPATVRALTRALEQLGHHVSELGDGKYLVERLLAKPPDIIFNIAEGRGVGRSREARVPAVCEMLGIAYTGSDPLALAVSLDKDTARRLVSTAGVPVPRGCVIEPGKRFDSSLAPYPAIIKPAWEGSSKGIRGKCVVHDDDELATAVERLGRDYRQPLVLEEFIDGDELTVGVLGNAPPQVLGMTRVVPTKATTEFVYSLEVKRDWKNRVRYETPPVGYDDKIRSVVEHNALAAYNALGCHDVARIDFRLRDGMPYFLEANPLPGLNPETGDLVLMAKAVGVSHTQLIGRILESAIKRQKNSLTSSL